MARLQFHPEAFLEYAETVGYYLKIATPDVAGRFADAVEEALSSILEAPERWRIVEHPGIRRYVLRRFPYVLYYRWEGGKDSVTVYAVMHCSRKPGYWRRRSAEQ